MRHPKTNTNLCFICQRRPKDPKSADGLLCTQCEDRRVNPPHEHTLEEFRFTPGAPVAYYSCTTCGWQSGPVEVNK